MGSSRSHGLLSEVVEDILSRLPVESLMRFKCVSKAWLSLLTKHSFVSLHLSRSMKCHASTNNAILLHYCWDPNSHKLSSLSGDFSLKQVPIPLLERQTELEVSNSCNGIVCMYSPCSLFAKDVALCNPATRELRFLPQSEMVPKAKESSWEQLSVGVGYDHRANDYRVVRVWDTKLVVEEYALSTDSWRIIGRGSQWLPFSTKFEFAMHLEGVYYWWAEQESTTMVVSLKVGGGDYQKVCMPHSVDISDPRGRRLCVLNGFVSLVCFNCYDEPANFDIWVMMDGATCDEDSCWTKMQCVIAKVPSYTFWNTCEPLGFWKGNELVTKRRLSDGKLEIYDIDSEEIQFLNFQVVDGEDQSRGTFEAIIYVKSLVSIKGRP